MKHYPFSIKKNDHHLMCVHNYLNNHGKTDERFEKAYKEYWNCPSDGRVKWLSGKSLAVLKEAVYMADELRRQKLVKMGILSENGDQPTLRILKFLTNWTT